MVFEEQLDTSGSSIFGFLSHPFEQWAYVLNAKREESVIVIDPGFETGPLLASLRENQLRVSAILNTHGHSDHIAGNKALKREYPDAPIIIGQNDAHLLTDPVANLSAALGQAVTSPPADRVVSHGDRLTIAGFEFEVREIPGHSPGSVVYVSQGRESPFVIGGDVLFAGSIGRCDFPGGDGALLIEGIRTKLLDLPDETRIYPGHGPTTTVGVERIRNPFIGAEPGTYRLD